MKLEQLIAVRYLFASRQRSMVNVISWISLIGLMVSTMALIIVLSVYNGIGEITKTLFNTFDPELLIEPTRGKTFRLTEAGLGTCLQNERVDVLAPIVSETAWLTYGDQQAIVQLRGVDHNYDATTGLSDHLSEGSFQLDQNSLVVGGEIFYQLGMRMPSLKPAAVHIPKRGTTSLGFTMDEAFNIGYAYPVANFFVQQDIDRRYVVAHIDFVRNLMNYAPDECTALAVKLKKGEKARSVKKELQSALDALGAPLAVKDRYDQQPLYFKIFRAERLGIYLILSLIVLIATLSLVASLSLLIIGKRDDIFILKSMGMERKRIRRAFTLEGLLICSVAVLAGLLLGFVVCLVQQELGLVRMGNGNFVVEAFPVAMRAIDFLATFLLVMTLSTLSVVLTVRRARI